jgi:hypothetical protein
VTAIEDLLKATPHVWPSSTVTLNGFAAPRDGVSGIGSIDLVGYGFEYLGAQRIAHGSSDHVLDVDAHIQAETPEILSKTTNALYLGIYQALKEADVKVATPAPAPSMMSTSFRSPW